jgi:hypothetical protein
LESVGCCSACNNSYYGVNARKHELEEFGRSYEEPEHMRMLGKGAGLGWGRFLDNSVFWRSQQAVGCPHLSHYCIPRKTNSVAFR